jgi:apolipoprotein N-acyltransferase
MKAARKIRNVVPLAPSDEPVPPINLRRAVLWTSLAALATIFMVPRYATPIAGYLAPFFWIANVAREFGHLPWVPSALLAVLFATVGGANVTVFVTLAAFLHRRFALEQRSGRFLALWFSVGIPALYALTEWAIPKIFPWYLPTAIYRQVYLIQIIELTGLSFLSFAIFGVGTSAWLLWHSRQFPALTRTSKWLTAAVPAGVWFLCIGFSVFRLAQPEGDFKPLRVRLVQANIGSIEKSSSARGVVGDIESVLKRYFEMTDRALAEHGPADLVVWPETAMPMLLSIRDRYGKQVLEAVARWNTPILTGAYTLGRKPGDVYNSAVLLNPGPEANQQPPYRKNVLLAFGEYFPFGDTFPQLYDWFPEVSRFARGTAQDPILLADGTKLGVTICYEAILPAFTRKVASRGAQVIVNLTNDSWFGAYAEPYQHAAISVFRAVETRLPMARATNTGISFTVDKFGRMSRTSGVYESDVIAEEIHLPRQSPETFYVRFGDWFVALCAILLVGFWFSARNALRIS